PIQAPVGRPGRTTVVVRIVAPAERNDTVPGRWRVQLGTATLETPADADCHGHRSRHRSIHPMSWRRVPPVHSPIAPRAVLRAAGAALGVIHATRERMEDE